MESLPSREREPEVYISPVALDDALEVNRLMRDTWLATYPNEAAGITVEDIEDRFKDLGSPERVERSRQNLANIPENETRLVARVNGVIAGLARMVREEDRNKLRSLYIHPAYQGQGIGTKLLAQASAFADPAKDTYLEVASYNDRAIAFYEKHGFSRTGKEFSEERFRMKSGSIIPEIEMMRPARPTTDA